MKTYKLLKPLPFCPAGRIFKETIDGTQYFLSVKDEDPNDIITYKFTKKQVEESPEFFKLVPTAKKIKGYRLIKDYPGCIREIGSVADTETAKYKGYDKYPEFWEAEYES